MTKLYHYLINQYPFYKKARDLWTETQVEQIVKGLRKYPEPFTPTNWTAKELLSHALQENVDQVHYLVGLDELLEKEYKKIEGLEAEISRLTVINAALEERIAYLKVENTVLPVIDFKKPPYGDLDD